MSFDCQQRSSQLYWRAEENDRSLYCTEGPSAGALRLAAKESVSIRVSGGGLVDDISNPWLFSIRDCFIITVPLMHWNHVEHRRTLAPTSPFLPYTCTDTISPGSLVRRVDTLYPDGNTVVPESRYVWSRYLAKDAFTVISSPSDESVDPIGRWDMSFLLTVDITSPDKDTSRRVFRFDPETEVGNGLNLIPRPHRHHEPSESPHG
ncbi:hypothetical protein CDL60_06120 [Roseateles noduli]|nr:hypothetical protein CDL60_06120 [Roseateles noduli]